MHSIAIGGTNCAFSQVSVILIRISSVNLCTYVILPQCIQTNWGSSEQSKNHMLLCYFIAKVRKILKSTLTQNPCAVPKKTWLGLKRKPKAAREYWSFPVIYNKSGDIWWQFAVYILKTDEQWKKPRLLSMFEEIWRSNYDYERGDWFLFPFSISIHWSCRVDVNVSVLTRWRWRVGVAVFMLTCWCCGVDVDVLVLTCWCWSFGVDALVLTYWCCGVDVDVLT